MDNYWIDTEQGPQKATYTEWVTWTRKEAAHQVVRTETAEFIVSTVFLMINHDFSGEGPGIFYETAFRLKDSAWDVLKRHSSRKEAKRFHWTTVLTHCTNYTSTAQLYPHYLEELKKVDKQPDSIIIAPLADVSPFDIVD